MNNSLEIDFKIMLNAKYFVNSFSTLSLIVNMISKYKKMIYYTPVGSRIHDFPEITYEFLELYYKDPFKSIDERNHKMIHYGKESYNISVTTINYFYKFKIIY
jgi:hypothetical protein